MIPEKIKKTIGWEPHISLEEGITRTAAWMRENI
jgi:nucleoside-diphosphate-sugar epimerase